MQKMSEDVLCEVIECYNTAKNWEENFFYEPDEPTSIQYVCILSRLEWMRRKLNKLGLCHDLESLNVELDKDEFEHDIENMTSIELNEIDYGVWSSCMSYSFEKLIMSYSESLGWYFCTKYLNSGYFDELSENILREYYKGTKQLNNIDTMIEDMIDDIYEGYIMVAPEIVSRTFYFVKNTNLDDIDAGRFLQYLPEWVTYYYIDTDLQCNGKLIMGNYVCSSVLCTSFSEFELGFESQIISLPFGIMLCNHYAIVLAEKYPEILGNTKVAVYG